MNVGVRNRLQHCSLLFSRQRRRPSARTAPRTERTPGSTRSQSNLYTFYDLVEWFLAKSIRARDFQLTCDTVSKTAHFQVTALPKRLRKRPGKSRATAAAAPVTRILTFNISEPLTMLYHSLLCSLPDSFPSYLRLELSRSRRPKRKVIPDSPRSIKDVFFREVTTFPFPIHLDLHGF